MTAASTEEGTVRSLVPARMDRLPWTKFHWMVVVGLGVSWILDGLEFQIVADVGGVLADPRSGMGFSNAQVGGLGSFYLVGQICGALVFGRLTDRLGRKKLFILTLAIYLAGSGLAGFSWDYWSLIFCRFIAGLGIGGEYTAINSAIDELIPAKYRGRVDIAINGTYWGGAFIGSAGALVLLNENLTPIFWGWRIAFFIGPVLGLIIIYIRRHIPESPRWQLTHGYPQQAEDTVTEIERTVESQGGVIEAVDDSKAIDVKPERSIKLLKVAKILFATYPKRSVLGGTMMITQAFLFNAIFFTYANVLASHFHVSHGDTPLFFLPFAFGNLLGPLILGPFFDTIGRRKMIFGTYGISAVVLAIAAVLFYQGVLTATTQTLLWCICFFFASAGASSAYLTVSEIFPLELRGQAIALFFCIGQGAGSLAAFFYGLLIGEGPHPSPGPLTVGYLIGAVLMFTGGVVALVLGIDAERKPLEDVATPLSAVSRSDDT